MFAVAVPHGGDTKDIRLKGGQGRSEDQHHCPEQTEPTHQPEDERQQHQPFHGGDARTPVLDLKDDRREHDVVTVVLRAEQFCGAPSRQALERRIDKGIELAPAKMPSESREDCELGHADHAHGPAVGGEDAIGRERP